MTSSKKLFLDIETYSSVDLPKSGVYAYSESPDFEILLLSYAINDGEVTCIDVKNGESLEPVLRAIEDHSCVKIAHNAAFERVCLSRYIYGNSRFLSPESWTCTATMAAYNGLSRTLAGAGEAIGLGEDTAKMKEGAALIRYFCLPCKPTKTNGQRTRNLPEHAPEKWKVFKDYNIRDVVAEKEIYKKLCRSDLPPREWEIYWLDQKINDRGVRIDQVLMRSAIRINGDYTARLAEEAQSLTGLQNIRSVAQLKTWLNVEGSLDKKAIQALLKEGNLSEAAERVLRIRQETGKSSIAKYTAMEKGLCKDGRVRGLFMFYGASRTGRWAGRQIQLQNLPQNHLGTLDEARQLVLDGDQESLELIYGNVPLVLSELIRTAIIPENGKSFAVADYSAIEARVIAWLADETWRMRFFREGGDIYCASASKMFGVPVVKHGINGHLRQKGKIAELACGYGGSVGAMVNMGALDMGLKEEDLEPIVTSWRENNPNIVRLWWDFDTAAKSAINNPGALFTIRHGVTIICTGGMLFIRLPSGRRLAYVAPRIGSNRFGGESITYMGTGTAGKWERLETFGGKLVENVVQAISRDCLADAICRVEALGHEIVMHVHDEMIVETGQPEKALSDMLKIMGKPPVWAPGLVLEGAGYVTQYYKKD